ncbi:hypothetical protein F5Y09DRAFT_343359 [Xylaria sp. FL1042]|nr:hypothetical protein F5Y09DRAFT_343359 [Xylaria sp. FL1042]
MTQASMSGVCPECTDSPLSVTGNVVGIATFALGVIAFCATLFTVTRGADGEIYYYKQTLEETDRHINQISAYFTRLELEADEDLEQQVDSVADSLRQLLIANRDISARIDEVKEVKPALCRRLMWWWKEKEIAGGMVRVESQKQHVTAIQLTFLLNKVKKQSDDIETLMKKQGIPPR